MPEMNREEIAKLEALYASNPEGRVFTHLAEAYRKAGEFERARSILEQGLAKHPSYASAHVVLGRVYADLNEMDQANASFRHVLELDPHNLVALRSLGDIARSQGQTDQALHYFEELRHQDPSNNDIEGVIAELKQAQMAPPAEQGAVFEESEAPAAYEETQPEFEASSPVSQDEPASMGTLPGFEDSTPDYGDLVSPDIDLGWSDAPVSDDALPGDLADFVTQTDAPPESELFDSEPEFAAPEFGSEATSFEAEAPIEPPIDAPIDLTDFEHIEGSSEYTSTEDPWSMTMEPAESDEHTPEESALEGATAEGIASEEAASEEYAFEQPAFEHPAFEQPDSDQSAWEEPSAEAEEVAEEPASDEPTVITFAHFESITTIETPAEPEIHSEPEPEAPAAPLMTETMAELFTEQGLYEQAAEVYRSLMAERPWDPDLPMRMAEAEAKARGEPAPRQEAETAAPGSPMPGDSEEKVESPWMAAPTSAASAPTPYAWTEDATAESADEGPPISGYFQSLLSWRPGRAVTASSPAPEPEPEGANFDPASAVADVPAIIELDSPVSEPAPEPEPWSAPASSQAAPAPVTSSSNPVEAAFDEWFNASDFGEEQAPAKVEAEPSESAPEQPAGEGDDDDDLEMFRSWLQSLKK